MCDGSQESLGGLYVGMPCIAGSESLKVTLASHTPYGTVNKAEFLEMMQAVYRRLFEEERKDFLQPGGANGIQAELQLVVPLSHNNARMLGEAP